jgi:hypothetical protein
MGGQVGLYSAEATQLPLQFKYHEQEHGFVVSKLFCTAAHPEMVPSPRTLSELQFLL